MHAYKHDVVVVIKMGAYIHWVLIIPILRYAKIQKFSLPLSHSWFMATLNKIATHSFSNLGCYDCHLFVLQLVSRHVIENSGDQFKKVSYEAPESGWPLSEFSWQC